MLRKLLLISSCGLLGACADSPHYCPKPDHDYLNNPVTLTASYQRKHHCIYPRNVLLSPKLTTQHYKTLSRVCVKKTDMFGITRQRASIDDLLRERAANLGSNAVININRAAQKSVCGDAIYIYAPNRSKSD